MSVASSESLFAFLDDLAIPHQTIEHPPIHTAEEGRDLDVEIPGLGCKNLFLKDKKGDFWLIVMPGAKRADLGALARQLGVGRFSFGNAELLLEKLGISPGSVTPFALLNDQSKAVSVVLDRDMMASEYVNYHPLHNAASTVVRSDDLLKFLHALDRHPVIIDCGIAPL